MKFITTPDPMAYHDQTHLRRWQDEDRAGRKEGWYDPT